MSDAPLVRLGDVLRHRKQFITIDDAARYKRCRVQLWAKGVIERDTVQGVEVKTKQQQVCRAGELLVAEIDAKSGGYGIVPEDLEGAIVSSHYFLYEIDEGRLDRHYLAHYIQSDHFSQQVTARGSTNYSAIRPGRVLEYQIPLPPIDKQREVAAHLDWLAERTERAKALAQEQESDARALLASRFEIITASAERRPLSEIAPLVRRAVDVDVAAEYDEIGIRSFGRGVFHKPTTTGADLGGKRVFWIAEGDLLFNIVFAWEGAVAVAGPDDHGRIGSHRFLTCVPDPALATAPFMRFFFLTPEGIALLGDASPGGAGRNKTLGLKALNAIHVPVPPLDVQREFDDLQERVKVLIDAPPFHDLDALLASAVARAFAREESITA